MRGPAVAARPGGTAWLAGLVAWAAAPAPPALAYDPGEELFNPPVLLSTAPVQVRPLDPFIGEIARRTGLPPEGLEAASRRGFGRTELISLAFMVRRSSVPWETLAARRAGGAPLRTLAAEAGLSYDNLFDEARALRAEIERTLQGTEPGPPMRTDP